MIGFVKKYNCGCLSEERGICQVLLQAGVEGCMLKSRVAFILIVESMLNKRVAVIKFKRLC
jgi:hypothetical protein